MGVHDIEQLSSDILDDGFIKVFQPIHIATNIVGSHRINIKYKYVTPPSLVQQFYSCILWVFNIVVIVDYTLHCETFLQKGVNEYLLKFGVLLNVVTNVALAWNNNFHNGNLNSQFYVKLQKIDRQLYGIINIKVINKRIALFSLIFMVILITLSVGTSVIFSIISRFCLSSNMAVFTFLGTYMEMVLVYFILYFIIIRVENINYILQNDTNESKSIIEKVNEILFMTSQINEFTHKGISYQLVLSMYYISRAITDFVELFKLSMFFFLCHLFTWELIAVQSLITALKDRVQYNVTYAAMCFVPSIASFGIVIGLSITAEILASKLRKSKKNCIKLMSSSKNHGARQNAKHLLLLLDQTPSLSFYDIFTLNTRLPLYLFAMITTYTVVLFQFAQL